MGFWDVWDNLRDVHLLAAVLIIFLLVREPGFFYIALGAGLLVALKKYLEGR